MTEPIWIGDCAEVLPTLGISPQLILTSPPYDNLRDYGGHKFDFERVADSLVLVIPDGGVLVWIVGDARIDGSETGTSFRQALGFIERGLNLFDTMIYHKTNGPVTGFRGYKQRMEYMFIFANGSPSVINRIADVPTSTGGDFKRPSIRQPSGRVYKSPGISIPYLTIRDNVWSYNLGYQQSHPRFPEAHAHPATFPYALAADHILSWTNPGDLVLDPMAGSGTALRAAKDLGREFVGIEIHEPYVEIIKKRLAQETLGLDVAEA